MEKENEEFEEQLEQEKLEKIKAEEGDSNTYTDKDGTVYEWDAEKKAWFPKIDENFIASYQMHYGTDSTTDRSEMKDAGDGKSDANYSKEYYEYYQNYYKDYYQNYYNTEAYNADNENSAQADDKPDGEENSKQEVEASGVSEADKNSEYYQQYHEYYKHYHGDDYHKYYDYYAKQFYENQGQSQDGNQNQEDGQEQGADSSKKEGGKGKKRKLVPQPKKPEVWFNADDTKNTNVYVSGLPSDITDEEYKELMNKCGLIMFDPFTKQPKLKLYRDKEGNLKGDGLCCYIKIESVNLALQILDGTDFRGHKIHVEPAKFELKGDFDPKKRKRLSNKDKKKMKEKQQKLFDWRPEKTVEHRFKFERVVVLKNMFSPKEFEEDPTLINEWRDDVRSECSKYGEVKNVKIFDNHPDGVMTVTFKEPEEADACIAALNGRWFSKRQISAEVWDGRTKYEIEESEAERDKRLQKWENFLETDEKRSKTDEKGKSDVDSNSENKTSSQDKTDVKETSAQMNQADNDTAVQKLSEENSSSSETLESKPAEKSGGDLATS